MVAELGEARSADSSSRRPRRLAAGGERTPVRPGDDGVAHRAASRPAASWCLAPGMAPQATGSRSTSADSSSFSTLFIPDRGRA